MTRAIGIPTVINVHHKYNIDNDFTSTKYDYERSDTNRNQRWQLEVTILIYISNISANVILDA